MMNKKFGLVALLVIIAGAVFGGISGNLPVKSSADATLNSEKIVTDYREALEVIDNNYVGKIDHEKQIQAAQKAGAEQIELCTAEYADLTIG